MFVKGDIITAYQSGFFKVVGFEKRYIDERDVTNPYYQGKVKVGDEKSGLVSYIKIATKYGVKIKSNKIIKCDESHCRHFDEVLKEEVERLERIKNIFKDDN